MKTIAVFNNKGGVGKTTLTYHLACAIAESGHRVLLVDLDPQSNLTLYGVSTEELHDIWAAEDDFIEDFDRARNNRTPEQLADILRGPRSVHFVLKPTEDGTGDIDGNLPSPKILMPNLDLIPGRLTVHMFENKLASRSSDAYQGDPLAIRTITKIYQLCQTYAQRFQYEYVLIDTSPSLGILNKVIISTANGFLIPCMPDMFSLYGIRNIGKALEVWNKEFDTLYKLLPVEKRQQFPQDFVQFLGFTIFNAKRYTGAANPWNIAQAHYNYAQQIPETIRRFIPTQTRTAINEELLMHPIGEASIMHTHNTMPAMAQKYRRPIWRVPSTQGLEDEDRNTIVGNRARFEATRDAYLQFAQAVMERVNTLR